MPAVIDETVLGDLLHALGDDRDALQELIDAFVEDAADLLDEASEQAVKDPDRFRRAVHSLKTTAATFGAMQLSEVCRGLEADAIAGRPVSLDGLDALARHCATATDALLGYSQAS